MQGTWCQQIMRTITRTLGIFDAVGLSIVGQDRNLIVSWSVLQKFPGILRHFDWQTNTAAVLRASQRFDDIRSPAQRTPTSEDVSRPTSAPREGRGRPLSAVSSDKTKGHRLLRPARREGYGRPQTAFPSDKFHGHQRPRPTLTEGLGRPNTGSGRDSPTGIAGLSVADTVRPKPVPSPPSMRRRAASASDEEIEALHLAEEFHLQQSRPVDGGQFDTSDNDGSEDSLPHRPWPMQAPVWRTESNGRPVSSTGTRTTTSQGPRNPRTFGLGPL